MQDMSDLRKSIAERLGSAGKVKSGRAEQVMRDGTVHLDFRAAKEWLSGVTDSALRYIISDAQQAAKAMPEGSKWNYYHDLSLTAQDELQRRKKKSSRPGAKAKFGFKVGDRVAYKPYPAKTAGELVEIRKPTRLEGVEMQYGIKQASGAIMWVPEGMVVRASRPGAKAKMAMIPIGTMRRLKKNYDEYLAYLHRNDPKRKPMSFDEFVDEHKESVENSPMFDSNQFSRPGAKGSSKAKA